MKSNQLLLCFTSLLATLLSAAQDKSLQPACLGISAFEKQRIYQKSKQYYSKIPQLKQWVKEQTGQDARLQNNHILLSWPLKIDSKYDDIPVYYLTWFFWDMASGNTIRDWKCSNKAYDGHNGVDIAPYPFWWHMKDNNYLYAAAAESGIVITVSMNEPDENCLQPDVPANIISILHSDSSITSYLHLKRNSALVADEQFVSEGQILAAIGSSGRSACPHLHFMVEDKNGNDIEPWTGSNPATDCNTKNEDSWWKVQKPHYDPKLNRIMTHSSAFTLNGTGANTWCRSSEQRFAKNSFNQSDSIYFGFFIADMITGSTTSYEVFRPGSSTPVWSGSFNFTADSTQFHSYTVARKLSSSAEAGTWKVVVDFRGQVETHYFTVDCPASYSLASEAGSYGRIASDFIESTATASSGNEVRLQAANSITLKPGFHAVSGSSLKARIRDCNYAE